MKRWMRKLTKFSKNGLLTIFHHTWNLLAVFLVIVALLFTLFRGLTPWVKHYREQIQQQLSLWVGQSVTIHDIQTSWYWFTPVLKLNQVTIGSDAEQILHLDQAMVGINLFSSLFHRTVRPGVLYLNETHLKIRQENQKWLIEGLSKPDSPPMLMPILSLLLAQDKVIIKQVSADIFLENGSKISLHDVYFKADHRAQNYSLYAQAKLDQKPNTSITMIANLVLDGQDVTHLSGEVYLSLGQTDLSLGQKWFPQYFSQIKQGDGHLNSWWQIVHGQVKHIQAAVALNDLVFVDPHAKKLRKITDTTVNLSWDKLTEGWRIIGDQCLLTLDGIEWPDNAFMLRHREINNDYLLYIKTLPFKQLLQMQVPWSKSLQPILTLKPRGVLTETQFSWKDGQLLDFLTQFSDLSWSTTETIPGVSGLTGAVYWQPNEGRLEINGDHSVIHMKKPLAPIALDAFNMALDWKNLSQGMRFSLERLVLSHPNLILSAAGALDNPGGFDEHLRLEMDFSAKDAQFWLPYIPAKGLKPKLNNWLKQDIPRIANATGQLRISGSTQDFPYDNHEGEFSVQAHVNGVDLYINKEWPLNSDINADIRVTGRNLVAEVDQAKLMDAEVHQINLLIPNIGSGKEVLLLHGVVNAPGNEIKSYVFASPLRKRLARWSGLNVSAPMTLELNLEVPLYPESDHVYAKGYLDFAHDPVSIVVIDKPAEFSDVSGRLYFNEYGLLSGGLDGTLDGSPFSVDVQPMVGQTTATDLRFEGEVGVDYLYHVLHHPIFSFMQGRFIVTGLWTVYPNMPNSDKLSLNSSLVGLALRLPKPFGKTLTEIAPLSVKIDFSHQHQMDFSVEYAQKVMGIFSLNQNAQHDWVTNGEFRIGSGGIKTVNPSGLKISGVLPEFDIDEWQKIWRQWPKSDSVSLMSSVKDVNLSIEKMKLAQWTYPNVDFQMHMITPQEWAFYIKQKDISGSFIYNWKKSALSAHIAKLHVEFLQSSAPTSSLSNPIKIDDIPDLEFTVDSLYYRGIDIGKLSFQTKTKPGNWNLNLGVLQTPEYELHFSGEWDQKGEKNNSNLEAQLHMSNLGRALARWKITPVVDAHYSQMSFSSHWPDVFYVGSLRKLNGQMSLMVKDGHISHLDKETEKKLGLGKLLSILSLQTIPRRLRLDFNDLAQKGYTFDIFKGNFKIQKGVMHTDDSYIEGPVAFGKMSGNLDLVNQLYDLDLRIFPYITASLPVVATLVGSPVAGIATWAVTSIANKGMQKVTGYTYKISGPWLSPVVQQVSIDKTAQWGVFMRLHVLGIGGTFMSALAFLARDAGYTVTGSDANCYPPISTLLQEKGIVWTEGYDNCEDMLKADVVIVGNAMKRGLPIVERLLDAKIPYFSGPEWLAQHILARYRVIAVAGTHGKTTTTSMIAHILDQAGLEPGFLIGGVAVNFNSSSRLGKGAWFVIEADEYDTAFFDKRPKFMHYRPEIAVLNNLEFDHADIYANLAEIQKQFHYLLRTVPAKGLVVMPHGDAALQEVIQQGLYCERQELSIGRATSVVSACGAWRAELIEASGRSFQVFFQNELVATVKWALIGQFNVENALAAMAASARAGVKPEIAAQALASFIPVKRRLEVKAEFNDICIYDDFAHHPTAIQKTIHALKNSGRHKRILVVLEFGSHTMKMGVHEKALEHAFDGIEGAYFLKPELFSLEKVAVHWQFPHKICVNTGEIVQAVGKAAQPGDAILVMSNRGFDNIHQRIAQELAAKFALVWYSKVN